MTQASLLEALHISNHPHIVLALNAALRLWEKYNRDGSVTTKTQLIPRNKKNSPVHRNAATLVFHIGKRAVDQTAHSRSHIDWNRAWGNLALLGQVLHPDDEKWYDECVQQFSGGRLATSMGAHFTVSGVPDARSIFEEELVAHLRPSGVTSVLLVVSKLSANDVLQTLPEVARIAAMHRGGDNRRSDTPVVAGLGKVFGGSSGAMSKLSSNAFFAQSSITSSRGYVAVKQLANDTRWFTTSHDQAMSYRDSLLERDFEKLLRSELKSPDIGLLLLETMMAHTAPFYIWYKCLLDIVQRVCIELSIPIVLDETLTGFGATGLPFAFQHYANFRPHFMIIGKRACMSALLFLRDMGNWLTRNTASGVNGRVALSTTTVDVRHLLNSTAFLRRLRRQPQLMANAVAIGAYVRSALVNCLELAPEAVTGHGVFVAFDKPLAKPLNALRCVNQRAVLPLDLTPQQADQAITTVLTHMEYCCVCVENGNLAHCVSCPASFHCDCIQEANANSQTERCVDCFKFKA